MRRLLTLTLFVGLVFTSCKEEEPPPTFPPEILGASVDCGDADEEDFPVVQQFGVTITDEDRDLLTESIVVSVNGILLDEVEDTDADDEYTWQPPASWDPPMICTGTFRFVVEVSDAEGYEVKQVIEVDKSS